MAGNKYLALFLGRTTEVRSIDVSAGVGDASKILAANSAGKLDETFLPAGIAADQLSVTASEAIGAGDLVNLHNSSGLKARKADGSNDREAHGFAPAAIANAATGTVVFEGSNTAVSGLTAGARLYLSDTVPGAATSAIASSGGSIVQQVGVALSATSFSFEPQTSVILAA